MSMEALEKVKHEIAKAEDRIRYYEQQDKIMRSEIRRLTRKERTHRLCTRGGLVEHLNKDGNPFLSGTLSFLRQ